MAAILEEVMIYSSNTKVTLIIDEFQRLADIDDGIISSIQNVWDAESHRLVSVKTRQK